MVLASILLLDLMTVVLPLLVALIVGVLVGWFWRPAWADFTTSSSILWCDFTPNFSSLKSHLHLPCFTSPIAADRPEAEQSTTKSSTSSSKPSFVDEADLRHLRQLVELKDGGLAWIPMMERSTPSMSYQAWRRDSQNGPPQYRSRTIFEDATPEIARDFFWDDEFRFRWDEMLLQHATLEECSITGAMVVRWIRKFPFFCSDREYVIGRRIWEWNRSYYCITKSVPCDSVPRSGKLRRVDHYYSSWCIRPVESRRDGNSTACEVVLFHHEDMGIPWEIAKLGVRQGMWGAVKKIDPGLRAYQKQRSSQIPLSRCAFMAHINTKVGDNLLRSSPEKTDADVPAAESDAGDSRPPSSGKQFGVDVRKLLLVGGAVAVALSVDHGLLTKAVIFGVARRLARIGRA